MTQTVTYYGDGDVARIGHLYSLGRTLNLDISKAQLELLDQDAPTVWIHCAVEGEWKGHPDGEFALNQKHFKRILDNFNATQNPVPLTYEHPEHRKDDGIAAGWIHKLKVDGDGLWAWCELTPKAASHIRSGEYRFCSVVVDLEATDRKTGDEIGPELIEVGLTNTPFIDGLSAIRLSRRSQPSSSHRSLRMNVKEALKAAQKELPDDASAEQVMQFIDGFMKQQSAASGEADENTEHMSQETEALAEASAAPEGSESEVSASEPEGEDKRELASDMDDQVRSTLEGLAESVGTDVAGLIGLLTERQDKVVQVLSEDMGASDNPPAASHEPTREIAASRIAALSKQVTDKDESVKRLSKRVEELESEATEREVSDAIEAGLFLDKDKDKLIKLARTDKKLWREWLDEAKASPALPTGKKVHAKPKAPPESDDDDGSDIDPKLLNTYLTAFRGAGRSEEQVRKLAVRSAREFLAKADR